MLVLEVLTVADVKEVEEVAYSVQTKHISGMFVD